MYKSRREPLLRSEDFIKPANLTQDFCSPSRHRNRRIAGYATVSTTQKTDKKTSQESDIIKSSLLSASFGLLMCLHSNAHAELRDPTRPLSFFDTEKTEQRADRLTLSAIWNTGSTKRATINGITAKQGDTILNNIKIVEIRPRTVIIRQQGEIQKLSLLSQPIKGSLSTNQP